MVSLMITDTHNLSRKLNGILCSTNAPNWGTNPNDKPSIEGLENAAETLDHFIDLLEDARIGVQRALVPADESQDRDTPRRMIAPGNETSIKLSVRNSGGVDLYISFEDKNFREYGLSFEEAAMLIRSFAILRMTEPAE
ncbi:MAG: hypothetical protein ABJO67_03715 [Pseudoruegeria sp.]